MAAVECRTCEDSCRASALSRTMLGSQLRSIWMKN
jgi:hypothetical protein